ncbi:MAG: aspartate/glutamate racemase family protein [Sphaerochaetaceae bacterium]|jgi:Asp/Glu/hydantoin racemase|nr:aspartate/glutamate racemase family protein [Sphaerochaetaceae bacterium]NLO59457.1 aspartate/glutamate racemase family protein [Spirochaetales bacterium]MDD2406337.1 aspartate/glutamate racemase family protein [Sphaerochaetaceae bacterium]MDD3670862.1 aspartate/glutamate racemase family protein [Sphaerochaetaceae bacterium]MDD4259128.1 aspartate/glutamate racemase family protein [Sphaerochaetaceae bacterium]
MSHITLIHTVRTLIDSFERQMREYIGSDIEISHILDEYLLADTLAKGYFSDINFKRLQNDIDNALMADSDVIVVTCSTLTPAVTRIRPTISVPLVAIDDAMCQKAALQGSNIAIMATSESTFGPTMDKIEQNAAGLNKHVTMQPYLCAGARNAMAQGDAELHDILIVETAKMIQDCDLIVLSQASMAHMEHRVASICNRVVVSSPSLCIAEVQSLLDNDGSEKFQNG